MKIYYLYAERSPEYGRTDIGYYKKYESAVMAWAEKHEQAKRNPRNSSGYKVDGYYITDFHIKEINIIED